MFNVFSGIRSETVVGVLHVGTIVFLILGVLFPVMFLMGPSPEKVTLNGMIALAAMLLFCWGTAWALFGISFIVEYSAALVKTASEGEEQGIEASPFESRVKAIERQEEPAAATEGGNGEDEGRFLISMPKHAHEEMAPPAPPRPLPVAEAGKCFESVKTYVDLEMWPLAYQKAQELLSKWPDSPEASKVRKNLEYIRQHSEEIEVPSVRP